MSQKAGQNQESVLEGADHMIVQVVFAKLGIIRFSRHEL
jgi:hypothetical protein